jgi:hypothetical protein
MPKSSRKPRKQPGRPERRIVVRGIRRNPPDIEKLARALIELAEEQVERDLQKRSKVESTEL